MTVFEPENFHLKDRRSTPSQLTPIFETSKRTKTCFIIFHCRKCQLCTLIVFFTKSGLFTIWQNSKPAQIESICIQVKFCILKDRKNIVGKSTIWLPIFIVFSNCFLKSFPFGWLNTGPCGKMAMQKIYQLFTKQQNSRLVQIESICRRQYKNLLE